MISAALGAVSRYAGSLLPGGPATALLLVIVVSTVVITFLFAMIYKFMPYERLPWRNVWAGALTAAALDADVPRLFGPEFVDALSIPPRLALAADGSSVIVRRPRRLS